MYVVGARAEHRGARVPARGLSGSAVRGRVRAAGARRAHAGRAPPLPAPARLPRLSAADDDGTVPHTHASHARTGPAISIIFPKTTYQIRII